MLQNSAKFTAPISIMSRNKQQRVFKRVQTIWIIMMGICVRVSFFFEFRIMSCRSVWTLSTCRCYVLCFNDSHNTQPSENYYNLLIAPNIFIRIQYDVLPFNWRQTKEKIAFSVAHFEFFSPKFDGDLPNVICSVSVRLPVPVSNNVIAYETDVVQCISPKINGLLLLLLTSLSSLAKQQWKQHVKMRDNRFITMNVHVLNRIVKTWIITERNTVTLFHRTHHSVVSSF